MRLNEDAFTHSRAIADESGIYVRRWIAGDDYHINWRSSGDNGRLSIEFSLSNVCGCRVGNLSYDDLVVGFDRVNAWLRDTVGYDGDVADWIVTRIDYKYDFNVDAKLYLGVLSNLWLGAMSRLNPHDHSQGVVWKSSSRWVKFYDKTAELGDGSSEQWLRYEVSNLKPQYMSDAWFGCDRSVREMCRPEYALYVLSRFWSELGLEHAATYESDDGLVYELQREYGSSYLSAHTALTLIRQHGKDVIELQLMSQSTYYYWLRRLRDKGFLSHAASSVPCLEFPLSFFLSQITQNLENFRDPAAHTPSRFLVKNLGLKNLGLKIDYPVFVQEVIDEEAKRVG